MVQRSILCMQGTQYATKRSILCRGAFCGPTVPRYRKEKPFFVVSFSVRKIYKKA